MRVIAGAARGTRLAAPPGMMTRPTSDRVKEALFNIVSSLMSFDDACILDICAGSGGLGIEALSRGAASALFIEQERSVQTVLQKNLAAAGCRERSETLVMEALSAIALLAARGLRFDLILFDPPYDSTLYTDIPAQLSALRLLKAEGILVVESSRRRPLPLAIGSLVQFDRRVYGDTALELYTGEQL